jgi:hypothetical protein
MPRVRSGAGCEDRRVDDEAAALEPDESDAAEAAAAAATGAVNEAAEAAAAAATGAVNEDELPPLMFFEEGEPVCPDERIVCLTIMRPEGRVIVSFYAVTEAQQRGSPHMHLCRARRTSEAALGCP